MQAIAITSVHQRQYSETFIHNHVDYLPYDVHYLYGGYLPYFMPNGQKLLPKVPIVAYNFLKPQLQQQISNYFQHFEIAAVVAEYGPCGLEMLPICEALNIPLLVYFHGYDIYRADMIRKYLHRYQALFAGASCLFAVSKEMAVRLIELGAPSRKVILNPCGANLELFNYHDAGKNEPIVFTASRFEETKHPEAVIKAFALVLEKVPNAKLRMAGTGSLMPKCRRLVSRLGINKSVTFTGVLRPVEVCDEMAKARLFAQHSVTTRSGEKEGAPVAIMEAGASGLPVVSTRHAGIRDIIAEEETGYLVEEGDVAGMAYFMEELLTDSQKASSMGLAAHKRIKQHFSLDKNIKIICQYIEQLMV
ncbi:MAG: glycosyltransferase [Chitinophagales bacterium]|nr:glycosyltransferase [Chitinophagales bacterium]